MRSRPRLTRLGLAVVALLVLLATTRDQLSPEASRLSFAALLVVLGLGWTWPAVAVRRVELRVLDGPTDALAGDVARVRLLVEGRGLLTDLRADGTTLQVDGDGWFGVVLPRRCIQRRLHLDVTTDGPLGVARATRRMVVDLPRPVAVGPRPVHRDDAEVPPTPERDTDGPTSLLVGAGDVVRTVRAYRPGDPAHGVHWPTSARAGELVVREMEPPVRLGVVLVVELRSRSEAVEVAVAEAAGLAVAVLDAGGALVLCTCEDGRPVAGEVRTPLQLSRRLAAATPGTPGTPPVGTGAAGWRTIVVAP